MKASVSTRRPDPFPFVLAELAPLRPTVKRVFGMTYVYCAEKLLLVLRDRAQQPKFNGVWLYTQAEHIASLRREFPLLPRHHFWRAKQNGWVILAARLEEFEEYVFRACELILRGDQRIGRVTRGSSSTTRRARGRFEVGATKPHDPARYD